MKLPTGQRGIHRFRGQVVTFGDAPKSTQTKPIKEMKTTINNKVYDTDKATLVAEASNYGGNDFRAWTEDLYLTAKGNWFLHGRGGPMSKYADHYLNSSTDGERIVPMTAKEAYAWCETHQLQKAIDQYFPEMIEEA